MRAGTPKTTRRPIDWRRVQGWRELLARNPRGVMTVGEAAKLLGCSRQTIGYKIDRRMIPSVAGLPGDNPDRVYIPTHWLMDQFKSIERTSQHKNALEPNTQL